MGVGDVCDSPLDGTNTTYALAAELGLGPDDYIDALSFDTGSPHPPPFPPLGALELQFSVAGGSMGPWSLVSDPAAIYRSTGGFSAALATSPAALGLAAGGDELDAYDLSSVPVGGPNTIFFSLAPGSSSLWGGGLAAGDIFVSSGGGSFSLFIAAESLGLCTLRSGCSSDDNVNALVVNTDAWTNVGQLPPDPAQVGAGLLFSLDYYGLGPGLPLWTNASDVLISNGGGTSAMYAKGTDLGLFDVLDNLDALDVVLVVPEPASVILVASGLAGLALLGRSRARHRGSA